MLKEKYNHLFLNPSEKIYNKNFIIYQPKDFSEILIHSKNMKNFEEEVNKNLI